TLGAIAERQRRPEHALWREFELARPHILGALLDAAAHGLRMLPPVFGRLAGYEDVNDAERLRHDPAMRCIVGGKTAQRSAAPPSQMGRFETQGLPARTSLPLPTCPASGSALCTAEGHPVASCSSGLKREPDPRRAGDERLERPLRLHLLSPAVRVQPVWRPRTLCSACRQRAQHWRLGRRAQACRGALPGQGLTHLFRADAAFAMPEVYEFLEAERIKYAIRLPTNQVLQSRIGYLLTRPVGRPPHHVRRFHANFSYQAGTWTKPRRVIAKVEWHPGELYPRVGFIVTNMSRQPERVVAF